MWGTLRSRPLRLVFTANLVSMLGSGMNSAAVSWYVLQATHSEVALGTLVVLQTLPVLVLMPFTGVIIDREDRRRLIMLLDAFRAAGILVVVLLCVAHRVQLWHLYLMNALVGAGFWMFWPTINALIQELTPEDRFVHSNTMLMAGVQGGWLLSGAVVGFVYNHIGLGGVLFIDFATYIVSLLCYFGVRKGRHLVHRPAASGARERGAVGRFVFETQDAVRFLRDNRAVVLLGISSALLIGTMLAQSVINPPLADRVLHSGATGFGWINAGWGIGAFLSALCVPAVVRTFGTRRSVAISLGVLALSTLVTPFSGVLTVAVALFWVMGASRGVSGVTINSSMMELVPRYYMGRVQNTFAFFARCLQMGLGMLVGVVSYHWGVTAAFAIIALGYAIAFITATWTARLKTQTAAVALESATGAE